MQKIVLTYGLIAGAVLSAMMVLTVPFAEEIGFDYGAVIGYTTMVLAFLMIFFGVRAYRDTVGAGQVSFGRAVLIGLAIVGVATVCYVATWEIVFYKFMPDFAENYAAYSIEQVRRDGGSEAEVDARRQEMAAFAESYKNPLVNIAFTALEPLPVGLVLSLVTAGIVSRRRGATVSDARAPAAS